MSYEQDYLDKLESIILAMGGAVPMVSSPTNFQKRSLELLEAVSTAASGGGSASVMPVGSAVMLPYAVLLSAQTYIDPAGWLWYAPHGGTIGNVGSGSAAAFAKLEQLFSVLWSHLGLGTVGWSIYTNTGLDSTAGATPAADWAAGKRLLVPDHRGRSLIAAGQGLGLTNRALGTQGGAETHALGTGENAPHSHTATQTTHGHTYSDGQPFLSGTPILANIATTGATTLANTDVGRNTGNTQPAITVASDGAGTPHNNMQPWAGLQLLWFSGVKG